jgi:hypothetical protein
LFRLISNSDPFASTSWVLGLHAWFIIMFFQ